MEKKDIKDILEKVSSGEFSEAEEGVAKRWLFHLHQDDEAGLSEAQLLAAQQRVWANLQADRPQPVLKVRRLWPAVAAAAVVLISLSIGLFFYLNGRKDAGSAAVYANDVAPGKVGATLTLSGGRKIRLADALKGELANEAGISVRKTADGQLLYQGNAGEKDNRNTLVNTLSTDRGETYMLTLPDGSKVWLNAASSLTYTTSLMERGKRVVRLSGEGYFEISRDKAHPFVVESQGQQVEVLGTHFNVSAYGDDADVRTTLLEGSVRVNEGTVLRPGQQAVLYHSKIRVQQVNAEDMIAWKSGLFVFDVETLESIMRKVSRWYNVEVVYEGDVNKREQYFGSVSRYDKVSKVLETLELTRNVHFKVEGRRITVMR